MSDRTRRLRLRDARVRTKLALISGSGIVAFLIFALIGTVGLGNVNGSAHRLAGIAKVIKQLSVLRDNEGDLRVSAESLAGARDAKEIDASVADAKDADAALATTIASLKQSITTLHDPTAAADFDRFAELVGKWQQIRDEQLLPAVQVFDTPRAQDIVRGPLAKADDAFAGPLDQAAERVTARVAPDAQSASDTYSSGRTLMLGTLAIGIAVLALLSVLVARMITVPLGQVSKVLRGLADGDLTGSADIDSRDEVGQMANALDTAMASVRQTVSALADNADRLASAADDLSRTNDQISASAEQTARQVATATEAAQGINASVTDVASGADQMSSAIQQIARNATDAANVATEAVQSAGEASSAMNQLDDSSREINAVIKLITSIAEQTSLLALNATIEAARAGDAGKGFAVVASEVKELAQETARATEDVAQRVHAISTDTAAAVAAITRINQVIEKINEYTTTIAAAVEEQTASTGEITGSLSEAAVGSEAIVRTMDTVGAAAAVTSNGSAESQAAAADLARMAGELTALVGNFRY
jgi:methyl-accepting chemotaxis protein